MRATLWIFLLGAWTRPAIAGHDALPLAASETFVSPAILHRVKDPELVGAHTQTAGSDESSSEETSLSLMRRTTPSLSYEARVTRLKSAVDTQAHGAVAGAFKIMDRAAIGLGARTEEGRHGASAGMLVKGNAFEVGLGIDKIADARTDLFHMRYSWSPAIAMDFAAGHALAQVVTSYKDDPISLAVTYRREVDVQSWDISVGTRLAADWSAGLRLGRNLGSSLRAGAFVTFHL